MQCELHRWSEAVQEYTKCLQHIQVYESTHLPQFGQEQREVEDRQASELSTSCYLQLASAFVRLQDGKSMLAASNKVISYLSQQELLTG